MKRAKSIFDKLNERRMPVYKAWYNPSTDNFIQFNTNRIHDEVAQEEFYASEQMALKRGYIRLYVGSEIDIESKYIPTDREFAALQYQIEKNSFKKFNSVIWDTDKGGVFIFPKQSFLFADSIQDAKEKSK